MRELNSIAQTSYLSIEVAIRDGAPVALIAERLSVSTAVATKYKSGS